MILRLAGHQNSLFFVASDTYDTRRVSYVNKKIQTSWKNALTRAGITRRLRPYDLRHNFITQALQAEADIKSLAEIVGSRPDTIMRHYQHVSRALHKKTVAKIPPLGIRIPKKKGLEKI